MTEKEPLLLGIMKKYGKVSKMKMKEVKEVKEEKKEEIIPPKEN